MPPVISRVTSLSLMLSGTVIGFICVAALLLASIFLAILDKKEKGNPERSRFFSRMALWLFIAAFAGGVAMTLVAGVQPRENSMGVMRGSEGPGLAGPERIATIGQVDEKEFQALQKKVAADPKDVASRERLGHLYLQQQDFENVFKMAHEALQLNPNAVESRVHMGMVLFSMGQPEQAMEQFDRALKIDPKNAEALRFKGMVESADKNHVKE